VGIKTAEKILGTDINVPLLDLWDKVLQAYDKKGYTEAEALQQARCARILRHGEYNKKTGEVKLWQPRRR
jgi:DNA polymerase-1